MRNRQSIPMWAVSFMLAYALMLPVASSAGAATELEPKESGVDNQAHESKHKHSHSSSHSHKKLSSEDIKQLRMKKVQRLAQYFEISVEGKSVDQLRAEIEQAKKEQPEKWEAFKQEFRAKKLEKMREYAESKGIDTKGKSLEQLHNELYELKQRAQ